MNSDFDALKDALIKRQKSLLSSLSSGRKSMTEGIEGIDNRKGDDIDMAESAYEQEMAYIMKSREVQELKIINEALEKTKKGKYGICEDCDELIGSKRLKAMPFVKLCVECQSRVEESSKLETTAVDNTEE